MVSELVTDMVNSSEAESVVNNIMEAILYTSYVEGEAVTIWRQMEYNTEIKSRIEKKLKEEEEEVRGLLEDQARAKILTRQEEALGRWLSIREEKAMIDLAASPTIMTVAEGIIEWDEDRDTKMKLEETEAEIDVSKLK